MFPDKQRLQQEEYPFYIYGNCEWTLFLISLKWYDLIHITAERCMGVFGGVSVGVTKQKESAHAQYNVKYC